MKIKYYRLSKEERKDYTKKYFKTKKGQNFKKYSRISLICSVILFGFGIYYFIDTYINHMSKWYYMYGSILLIISIIMIVSIHNLKIKIINNYIVKK